MARPSDIVLFGTEVEGARGGCRATMPSFSYRGAVNTLVFKQTCQYDIDKLYEGVPGRNK